MYMYVHVYSVILYAYMYNVCVYKEYSFNPPVSL